MRCSALANGLLVGLVVVVPQAQARDVELQWESKKVVSAAGPGEAVVVVIVSKYGNAAAANIQWRRLQRDGRNLFVSEEAPGIRVEYRAGTISAAKADDQAYIGVVEAGDYVLTADAALRFSSFCLGAPVFRVEPGSVTYIGGFRVYTSVKMKALRYRQALGWEGSLERAKAALAARPDLRERLVPAKIENGLTFRCPAGADIFAYEVPGAPALR